MLLQWMLLQWSLFSYYNVADLGKLFRNGEELSLGVGNPRFPSLVYKTLTSVKVKYWVFYRFTADKQR